MVVVKYSFAERIKAEILIASNLIETIQNFGEIELVGAKKLLIEYLSEIKHETAIAHQITKNKTFADCEPVLNTVKKNIEEQHFSNASQLIGHVLSRITTICQQTSSLLEKQGLL